MNGVLKKCGGAAAFGIGLVCPSLQAQAASALVQRAAVEEGASLVDLRNQGYAVVFPKGRQWHCALRRPSRVSLLRHLSERPISLCRETRI